MTSIEPHIERERFSLGLGFQKIDSFIDDQFRLMAQSPVGHFLVKGIPPDDFTDIKVILLPPAPRSLSVPLTNMPGAIILLAKKIGVELLHHLPSYLLFIPGSAIAPRRQTGKNRGPARPADGMAHKSLLKTHSSLRQSVNVRSLHGLITVTPNRADRLIISKEKDNVGLIVLGSSRKSQRREKGENWILHYKEPKKGFITQKGKPRIP